LKVPTDEKGKKNNKKKEMEKGKQNNKKKDKKKIK